jgi:glutathione synthase/RimK-type ligase-like ATP-grasp enzyme
MRKNRDIKVAIIKNDFHDKHGAPWSHDWIKVCLDEDITFDLVEWRVQDVVNKLKFYDIVLWHFSHYSYSEMSFARSILSALKYSGVLTFPAYDDYWHFDDKVSQVYLLNSLGSATPSNWIFYSLKGVNNWLLEAPQFPIVAKLKTGSGSNNVRLFKNTNQVKSFAQKMFSSGINTSPSPIFKIRSNLQSSRSWGDVVSRLKKSPSFFFSLTSARQLNREKSYVYLQEFIPGAKFDIKVAVVGEKLSFIGRKVRIGDFRASGGGDLFYDRSLVSKKIIDIAFNVADHIGSQCLGLDFVINPIDSEPYIIEISFGFSSSALENCGGYFTRSGEWVNTPLSAPREILCNLIGKLSFK